MSRHLQTEIDKLKGKILSFTSIVESNVRKAVQSLEERDPRLAQDIIDADVEMDRTEVEIEEDCLKVLALHQPVAVDLRFIVAVLKINNDIERVGDLGMNIAERTLFLSTRDAIEIPFNLAEMSRKTLLMLRLSLESLMNLDACVALQVCAMDDEVDEMNREMYQKVFDAVRKRPENVEPLSSYLSASRYLERIADSATNIAEDVIYLIEGEIVRHKPDLPKRSATT